MESAYKYMPTPLVSGRGKRNHQKIETGAKNEPSIRLQFSAYELRKSPQKYFEFSRQTLGSLIIENCNLVTIEK